MSKRKSKSSVRSFRRSLLLAFGVSALAVLTLLSLSCTQSNLSGSEMAVSSLPAPPAEAWQLQKAKIVFAREIEPDRSTLELAELESNEQRLLADPPNGVYDFELSPDGQTLLYAAWNEAGDSGSLGGIDIWSVEVESGSTQELLSCGKALCTSPRWSPDGKRIVYERRAGPGMVPELWLIEDGAAAPRRFAATGSPAGFGADWAPDGTTLSYISPEDGEVKIVTTANEAVGRFQNQLGIPPHWDAGGEWLLIVETNAAAEDGPAVGTLQRLNVAKGQVENLLEDVNMLADAFAGSPDGKWIATIRPDRHDDTPSLGGQVWILAPDGSNPRQITQEADVNRMTLAWSPDSSQLLVVQRPLKQPGSPWAIWLLDVDTGETRQLVSDGQQPVWLP